MNYAEFILVYIFKYAFILSGPVVVWMMQDQLVAINFRNQINWFKNLVPEYKQWRQKQ